MTTNRIPGSYPITGSTVPGVELYLGDIAFDGYGAVSLQTIPGISVAKTDTGEYTFTVTQPGNSIVAAFAQLVCPTDVSLTLQQKSKTNSSIVYHVLSGATPTDPTHAGGIDFLALVKRSSLTR